MRQPQLRPAHVQLREVLDEGGRVLAHPSKQLPHVLVAHAGDAGRLLDDRAQLGVRHPQLELGLLLLALLRLQESLIEGAGCSNREIAGAWPPSPRPSPCRLSAGVSPAEGAENVM